MLARAVGILSIAGHVALGTGRVVGYVLLGLFFVVVGYPIGIFVSKLFTVFLDISGTTRGPLQRLGLLIRIQFVAMYGVMIFAAATLPIGPGGLYRFESHAFGIGMFVGYVTIVGQIVKRYLSATRRPSPSSNVPTGSRKRIGRASAALLAYLFGGLIVGFYALVGGQLVSASMASFVDEHVAGPALLGALLVHLAGFIYSQVVVSGVLAAGHQGLLDWNIPRGTQYVLFLGWLLLLIGLSFFWHIATVGIVAGLLWQLVTLFVGYCFTDLMPTTTKRTLRRLNELHPIW